MIGALGQKRALNGDQLKNPGANHLKFVVLRVPNARWDISVSLVDSPGVDENSRAMS